MEKKSRDGYKQHMMVMMVMMVTLSQARRSDGR